MTEPVTNAGSATQTNQGATPQDAVEERIRNRAYELYEKRNGEAGDAESDWYRAETEISEAVDPAE